MSNVESERKIKMNALEIKGKVNTALCYAKVVEDEAIEQIRRMCDYAMTEGSQIRIMPDVHAGKGCTIGTTMTITDKAVPNVVGVDIGCGMYTVNLGKDEIDFYWLHRDDPEKPVEEIVDILEELKKEGRIRYYGFSNYCTERLKQIEKCLRDRNLPGITAVSNQWSLAGINPGGNTNPDPTLVEFSGEEFKWHCETGAASIPFSSTAMGFFPKLQKMGLSCTEAETDASWMQEKEKQIANLSESMKKAYWNETNLRTYQKLLKLQKETGHSLQALSLAYFFHQPFQTVPVTGVSNLTQLKDAIDACEIDLAPERFGGWVSAGGDQ